MARDLTAGMLTAIAAGTVRPAIFYEGEYESGGSPAYLRLWSGIGPLSWDSKTWAGAGELLGLSPVEETVVVKATTLSGVPAALVAVALSGVRQNRPGTIWFACLDASGAVIADPMVLRRGLLDTVRTRDTEASSDITVSYASRLVDLERPRARYYTPEDHKIDHPADLGFDFVPALQDAEFKWP